MKLIKSILYGLLISTTSIVMAENNAEAPIQIRADFMRFDIKTSSSIYEGNVNMEQGSISITGDQVIVKRTKDELRMIEVNGQPASFVQIVDNKKVEASSEHIEYASTSGNLVLINNAQLKQADRTVNSQRIVYNTKNQAITAGKTPQDSSGRVNITLTPVKENFDDEE